MFNDAPPSVKYSGGARPLGKDSGTDGWGKERRQRGVCIVTVITVTVVTINFLYLQKT